MPTVRKTSPGTLVVHGTGSFDPGTEKNVDSDTAEYLVDERGGFEYANGDFPREGDAEDVDFEESAQEPTDGDESIGVTEGLSAGDQICTCGVNDACDACGGDCPTVKSDGEVCGRDRPCSYHDNEDDSE